MFKDDKAYWHKECYWGDEHIPKLILEHELQSWWLCHLVEFVKIIELYTWNGWFSWY